MNKVVVIGQGYVGLPMALRAAEVGHSVVGLDLNANVVADLNNGVSHIDDVSCEELSRALRSNYMATADASVISTAEVVVVCVPTPLSEDGGPDLLAVESAGRTIGEHVTHGTLCILESTTYPGTTEEIFAPLVAGTEYEIGEDIFIAFSPERIDPGNDKYGVQNTPKVVGGITDACTVRSKQFYESFVDTVVATKGAKEAEMTKLLENTFRHVNIALVNEMVRFCQELDIDLWNSIDAAATKPFGFMPFRPGPGVGGHCIPIDPSYLSHRVKAKLGYAFRMVELAEEINHAAPEYVADRVRDILNKNRKPVNGSRVLLVGVAYKANISDERESPAIPLAKKLESWGASIEYFDPLVPRWSVGGSKETPLTTLPALPQDGGGADVIILLQAHDVVNLDTLQHSGCPVLDTRGVLREAGNVDVL